MHLASMKEEHRSRPKLAFYCYSYSYAKAFKARKLTQERGLDGDENNILAHANVMDEDKNDGDDSTSELDS